MNGYAITDTAWRGITADMDLAEGETFVEELPHWLIDKAGSVEVERDSNSKLSALLEAAGRIIQPLQDDFDIDEISEEDLVTRIVWKRYRSALGKTPERPGWPEAPDWPASPEL
ncbi:tail fiber assembly protein [Pseudomonas farris]